MNDASSFIHFRSGDWRRRRHAGPVELVLLDSDVSRQSAFVRAARRLGVRVRIAANIEELREALVTLTPDLAVSVHSHVRSSDGELSNDVTELASVLQRRPWQCNWAVFTEDAISECVAREGPPSGVEQLLLEMDVSLTPN